MGRQVTKSYAKIRVWIASTDSLELYEMHMSYLLSCRSAATNKITKIAVLVVIPYWRSPHTVKELTISSVGHECTSDLDI